MSRKCYLFLGWFATFCVYPCEQCSPVEPLTTALQTAQKTMLDGRIALNMDKPWHTVSVIQLPSCPGQTKVAAIYRVPAGQTAVFACTGPECSKFDRESCAQLDAIMWGHQNYSVRHVITREDASPFKYSLTKNATYAHLLIHNVSGAAAGLVQCGWNHAENSYCIMAVYDFKPLLTATDIFLTSAQNITLPAGQGVTLRCDLQASLNGAMALEQRYMWWYGSQLIMAPSEHAMAGMVRPLPSVRITSDITYTSATFSNPSKSLSGRYQCWVRPSEDLDEWFAQDIYLDLM